MTRDRMLRDGIAREVLERHAALSHKGARDEQDEWSDVLVYAVRATRLFAGTPLSLMVH